MVPRFNIYYILCFLLEAYKKVDGHNDKQLRPSTSLEIYEVN